MRIRFALLLGFIAQSAAAQLPPIIVEWSALRTYPSMYGPGLHIARDPIHDQYVWAVNGLGVQTDEVANVFLPDGTDVTPLFPFEFNVGSLDALIDMDVRDSVIHHVMHRMNIGGSPQDIYWHLDGNQIQTDADGYMNDRAHDLLVTSDAAYGCGSTDISFNPSESVARVVKQDLAGNILWNVTWDDPNSTHASFTSMAVIGDSIFCAAFPNVVILDKNTGDLISVYDMTGQNLPGSARLLAHGPRLYWCVPIGSDLWFGQMDFSTGQGQVGNVNLPGQSYQPSIAVDAQDRLWLATTISGQGRWFLWDYDLAPLGNGTLYQSIEGMCFVNGKISFTGVLDYATSTAYLITGTPQP